MSTGFLALKRLNILASWSGTILQLTRLAGVGLLLYAARTGEKKNEIPFEIVYAALIIVCGRQSFGVHSVSCSETIRRYTIETGQGTMNKDAAELGSDDVNSRIAHCMVYCARTILKNREYFTRTACS